MVGGVHKTFKTIDFWFISPLKMFHYSFLFSFTFPPCRSLPGSFLCDSKWTHFQISASLSAAENHKMKGLILDNGYPHEEELDLKKNLCRCAPDRSQVEPFAGTSSAFKYQKLTEILNAKVGKMRFSRFFQRYPNFAAMKGWLPDVGWTQDFQPSSVMSSLSKIPSLKS